MRTRLSAALSTLLAAAAALAQPAGSNPLSHPTPADAPAATTISLTNPGAEPRQTLRFKPSVGAKQSVEMVTNMSQEGTMGGMPTPSAAIPAITMPMVIEVTAVDADGWISYTATFGKPVATSDGQAAMMAAQINSALAGLENAKASAVVSDRGVVREASMLLAGDANPMLEQMVAPMNQSMKQFCVPVPEEAVGVGASWTVEFPLDMQGIKSIQVATYTLREVSAAGCILDAAFTQSAAKQDVQNAALPPGVTLSLESLDGSGSGSTNLAFDRVMPTSASSNSVVNTQMTVNQGGQPMAMTQKVQMNVEIREAAGAAHDGEAAQ